jgi:uncharacterized membrane protein
MNKQLLLGFLLTILPISELRGGLPVVIGYALQNSLKIWPLFLLVILLNILVIFFIYFFLDFFHEKLLRIKTYRRIIEKPLERLRKKARKFEKSGRGEFFGLFLLVAIPIPGTGAWTGCLISWILGINRKKSILAISLGVLVAGLIILLGSLGFFSLL